MFGVYWEAISQVTERLQLFTGVTCPTMRIHPAIVAQAAATAAALLPGRFSLGVGSGENLNEHILGDRFRAGGGEGKATYGQLHVCWAKSEEQARQTALEWWPNGAVSGSHFLELPLPSHFEEAVELIGEEDIAESVVCGPDPERHLAALREYVDAGYDHVYVHQVGPDQEGFFDFYEREILPEWEKA